MEVISKDEARKISILSSLQNISFRNGNKLIKLENIFNTIGYVQIDTISVVQRAHHHVLRSRLSDYSPSLLMDLEEKHRKIFEYWSHAASYLPMKDFRFSLVHKKKNEKAARQWFRRDRKLMNYVFDRITNEGPLMSKDFEDTRKRISNIPWDWKPTKRALWILFMEGKLMISGRKGFQKVFDLPERVVPGDIDLTIPSKTEYIRYLILRDLKSHGILKPAEIGYLLKGTKNIINTEILKLEEEGIINEISIKGLKEKYYLFPQSIEILNSRLQHKVYILSPFDNLIIQRQRLSSLFDFNYNIECYVPAQKRKFGYFGLPLLYGSKFIGQIDIKADRKRKILIVNNLEIKSAKITNDVVLEKTSKEIFEFREFNECNGVEFKRSVLKNSTYKELAGLVKSQH